MGLGSPDRLQPAAGPQRDRHQVARGDQFQPVPAVAGDHEGRAGRQRHGLLRGVGVAAQDAAAAGLGLDAARRLGAEHTLTAGDTDIAAAVAYLISEDAGFVTGQTLNVDGGLYMH